MVRTQKSIVKDHDAAVTVREMCDCRAYMLLCAIGTVVLF